MHSYYLFYFPFLAITVNFTQSNTMWTVIGVTLREHVKRLTDQWRPGRTESRYGYRSFSYHNSDCIHTSPPHTDRQPKSQIIYLCQILSN